eukprot:gene3955-15287_t
MHLFTLKTLLRQRAAIRGNDDTISNIFQFNLDKSRTDERLFLNSRSYFGHAILSEQEQMLVLEGRMQVLEEIKGNRYFVLIADEPTDVSKKEQMPITLRACTKDFVVKEYFMGIHKCEEGIAAEPFFKVVKDVLIRCGLSPKMPTGCTFDGASAMVKLGRLINEYTNGQSVYIHCLAHCNDMIIRDAIAKSSLFANATLRCQDLYALAAEAIQRPVAKVPYWHKGFTVVGLPHRIPFCKPCDYGTKQRENIMSASGAGIKVTRIW